MLSEGHIVVFGGGTGLSVLLQGLKKHTSSLTAVVTVTDDGGSSGRLRDELGVLPPGDIRNCLVALADRESLMEELFQYRFPQGDQDIGHCLGNLLLVAMSDITGDFVSGIQAISKVLAVSGQVLPATLDNVNLGAVMKDGSFLYGETAIRASRKGIERLFLVPSVCHPLDATLAAVAEADAIIIGPGSLYSSVIPNLLVDKIPEAIAASKACKIYVANIMTEAGETDAFSAADHVREIEKYLGQHVLDYVLVNESCLDEKRQELYQQEEAQPVLEDHEALESLDIRIVRGDLLAAGGQAWHDPDKLAQLIMDVWRPF